MTIFLLLVTLLSIPANAVPLALDPHNKVYVGASWIDKGYGASFGMESRLTQLVYINMGGFVTLTENIGNIESDNQQDWIRLQHGVVVAPGWRIPHRYRDGFNWDIILRGGFACLFTGDANRTDLLLIDPAGFGGADIYFHKENIGIRLSTKSYIYQPELTKTRQGLYTVRYQSSLDLFYQWK